MNMLSKPVERCRKTSYSLNLSLVLSVLNALYKLLEKFCCILSLKKHLQAMHISVQSAHRTSLRRPAARTAARKSAPSCEGWESITRRAACWGVSRWLTRADPGSRSWMHPPAVAEVEADRLHHLERRALGEDIGGREHARVLLDHRCGSGPRHLVQAALERGPHVLAVLDEDGRQIDAVDRLPAALGDICHVLLMQRYVVARTEPAHVAADVVLPRVRERVRVGRDVAGDVFRQVRQVDRCPCRVDNVDEHERLVVRQVDEDVVGGVVGAVPGEVDAFAADLERPL